MQLMIFCRCSHALCREVVDKPLGETILVETPPVEVIPSLSGREVFAFVLVIMGPEG